MAMKAPDEWLEGGCHCGAVRFSIRVQEQRAIACNCSMCAKKGMVNVIVEPQDFRLLTGDEALTGYRFNTRKAEHLFCSHCGIHPFSRPRSHPGAYDVNGRCLDEGVDDWEIAVFDGQNWEANVGSIQ
ncbi:glutathione-dependent formaldehyde-activating, GFA [Luminiphilus syltensis NOR5-1B]|uniref:Glutathione-dependent formaldehyde-activating, GFA n=1 Tax=Luminiphilus syltensis NOR5-1B TaxID=565045 RepID=B8KVF1_9GAMM|nr:GFA family protein [Luminiphilus syltensis]EED36917.1 glutathione-dependent formaldehyde-activating, GFA [Luminiphilus syltensis NOR5-1B]